MRPVGSVVCCVGLDGLARADGRLGVDEVVVADAAERAAVLDVVGEVDVGGLQAGALDLPGVVEALDAIGFDGWLMVEQDSSWLPPAQAAEIGLRALRAELDR